MEIPEPEASEDKSGKRIHETDSEGLGSDIEGYAPVAKRHTFPARTVPEKPSQIPIANKFSVLRVNLPEKNRPPPIIIAPPIAQAALKNILIENNITLFSINSSSKETRLYVNSENDHFQATLLLRQDNRVQFHSFAPRGTKRSRKYVLHGFDIDFPVEEIVEELKTRLPGFRLARRLTKRYNPNEPPKPIELIQIITDDSVKLTDIAKLYHISQCKFRVSIFKEDGVPAQCRNCQEYGHTMKYCGRTCACPWCGGVHTLEQCPKTVTPWCKNCKGAHPTSSKECLKRQELVKKIREITKGTPTKTNTSKQSKWVQEGLAYSTASGGAPVQSEGTSPHHQSHPHHQHATQFKEQTAPTQSPQPSTSTDASLTSLVMTMLTRMDKLMDIVARMLDAMTKKHHD